MVQEAKIMRMLRSILCERTTHGRSSQSRMEKVIHLTVMHSPAHRMMMLTLSTISMIYAQRFF